MTGRTVPEWVATHPDQAIPKAVKLRIWEREQGRCHLSGLKINALKDAYEFEHVIALANGGEHREFNIKLALKAAHKAKTAERREGDGEDQAAATEASRPVAGAQAQASGPGL
jgi:5-methylcytosine-specific restriction protein A